MSCLVLFSPFQRKASLREASGRIGRERGRGREGEGEGEREWARMKPVSEGPNWKFLINEKCLSYFPSFQNG